MLFRSEILPVYILDPSHFETNTSGLRKVGKYRAQYLLEALKDLDASLRARGSGLMILYGKAEVLFKDLLLKHEAERIYTKHEIAWDEIQTQSAIIKGLPHCELLSVESSLLFHKDDLRFVNNKLPYVFTEYRKQVEKHSKVRGLFACPDKINSPKIEEVKWPKLEDFGFSTLAKDPRAAYDFKGGETEALKRLKDYLFGTHSISKYKETRNGMIGENYSSKFSAALALGCLSTKNIYHEIKRYEEKFGSNDSTYWLVFELMWRDYFRLVMEKHPKDFFMRNGIQNNVKWNLKHSDLDLENWKNGKTPNDFVNANMLELKLTGFMSNRGRQNVAGYLHNDLKLDWRYGAAYFEQQLIDYDVCSNWGNWAYLAGVGNDPRGQRLFNTEKQALDYDKTGEYRKLWNK